MSALHPSNELARYLITLYTRTPLHVGCGTSVEIADLPIARERITQFPVMPSPGVKGVLRDHSRHVLEDEATRLLFGEDNPDEKQGRPAHAGCVQVMEVKLLAFPVRSVAGCFAWLTCPALLRRFNRDTDKDIPVPTPATEKVVAGKVITIQEKKNSATEEWVVLEEFALQVERILDATDDKKHNDKKLLETIAKLTLDKLWTETLAGRLAVVSDENFQHFVTSCTELVSRIKMNPATRTNENLFNQENVPCETLFYTVIRLLPPRKPSQKNGKPAEVSVVAEGPAPAAGSDKIEPKASLEELFKPENTQVLQFGGDETTGHGFCELSVEVLPTKVSNPESTGKEVAKSS